MISPQDTYLSAPAAIDSNSHGSGAAIGPLLVSIKGSASVRVS
jgi:hypothetical protein